MADTGALARRGDQDLTRGQRWARRKDAALASAGLSLGGSGIAVAAMATGHWWLMVPAVLSGVASAALAALPFTEAFVLFPGRNGAGAQIGLGATVDQGATVEPGARVEMGATVQAGAVVRAGAVVGMGSTIHSGATIEQDAIIGWGATVQSGAVVGRGAAIGAGSTVQANARVAENVRIGAGSTVSGQAGDQRSLPGGASHSLEAGPTDERDARVDALCDRVEAELAATSSGVDEFLKNPRETVLSVRRTCHDLLQRERALRKLLDPAEQERLTRETTALEARIASESDQITRTRLEGAVAAILEHRRQRDILLRDANRLEAEHTRLVWTLEGLLAHVIRLRTSDGGASSAELDRGLTQLREEVSSIASAMEHVQTLDFEATLSAEAPSGESRSSRTPVRS
jgi:carbonic anhydrase/acetyltransferase-like protein (isoleucine patch superfamily)